MLESYNMSVSQSLDPSISAYHVTRVTIPKSVPQKTERIDEFQPGHNY
jgi:hypothetical protein